MHRNDFGCVDQMHKLIHLWKAGELVKVDVYVDSCDLKRNALFAHRLQALIELSNHIAARGGTMAPRQAQLALATEH